MVVLNFIKSLFVPKDMARHRFMTVLIAICLFVCSTYLLLLPTRYYYLHNTSKLVDNNNLYYLQSIRDLDLVAPGNPDILDFENEFVGKGLYTEKNKLKASHLGLYEISTSDDFIGYLQKIDGIYYYNGVTTNVIASDETVDKPIITALDNKFVINGVNNNAIGTDKVSATDEIKVVKISLVSSNSHLEIDGSDSGIIITSSKVDLTLNDNKLVVNGIITSAEVNNKTIFYFVPKETTYYERSISYVNDKGVKQNILFVIDLNNTFVSKSPYTVDSYECDYLNEDYYFMLFYGEAIYYQANLAGINDKKVERNGNTLQSQGYNISLSKLPFDLTDMVPTDLANYLYVTCINGYASLAISNFSIISLIYVVGFTLVVSLLFSLLFRKTGRMKKFKEYYNIASIANIAPVIVTFIVMWFNPSLFGTVYLCTFAVYYLFVLYKINNSSETI